MEAEKSFFSECLYFSTSSLARTLTRMAEDAFARTGLSPSYAFVVLTVNRQPGISPSGIARQLDMQPSTITRFLDKLELKKLIKRRFDGRISSIYPTEKAQEMNLLLDECWDELKDQYREELGLNMSKMLANNISEANDRLR
jgi:DNA-binding MarR family transcriptional regulator